MKTIKNLKLVNSVLQQELPEYKFDKLDMLVLSDNLKIFYIGNREDNTKTLFKHSDKDNGCYYDILNGNEMYYNNMEKLYEVDSDNFCTNLESLEELTKKLEKEKR